MSERPLGLFAGFGVELEYMLVDAETLAVLPAVDRLLAAVAGGEVVSEVELGEIAWSNELVLHVVELKTAGPAPTLVGLAEAFQRNVRHANALAAELGGRLLPGGMHPLMDPERETRLWPHEYSPVYEAFDRIFDCRGHGWSNLQSAHLNLPFANDREFRRLHAAIRLLLPLLPALAASSPVVEGRLTGRLDNRLDAYRANTRRIPSVTAEVIPETASSRREYQRTILEPMYRDIAPFDPDGILQHEFLNARGAIARFDRGAIEIRVLDVQECPAMDLAVIAATVGVLRMLVEEGISDLSRQESTDTAALARLFRAVLEDAERTTVDDPALLAALGQEQSAIAAGPLWRRLLDRARDAGTLDDESFGVGLEVILDRGPLARRLLRSLGPRPDAERIRSTWRRLADCLQSGKPFDVR